MPSPRASRIGAATRLAPASACSVRSLVALSVIFTFDVALLLPPTVLLLPLTACRAVGEASLPPAEREKWVKTMPNLAADWVKNNASKGPTKEIVTTYMNELRKSGDSCGARIRVTAQGMPVGLGEPLFDKLDADIAYAMMGINAVKGVEIGAGFASVSQRGTTHGDSLTPTGFASNNAGGVLGGVVGNQVGKGNGRAAATILGAIGGG